METHSVVVLARPELAPAIQEQLAGEPAIATFSTSEAFRAFEAICHKPPKMIAMDSRFVKSARGAGFVARIKDDPRLASVELRVLAEDETQRPLFMGRSGVAAEAALIDDSVPIGRCGTRHAVRFRMRKAIKIVANGGLSELVDLSTSGAQLLTAGRLRPEQPIRLTLGDDTAMTRIRGVVAWVTAELSNASVRYRAGVAFTEYDPKVLEALCRRHGFSPDSPAGTTA